MAGSSNSKLANRILIGLVIGIVAALVSLAIGQASPAFLAGARTFSTQVLDPIGQIFLRMLFFVVIPLVFASLATGVVQLGRLDKLGPLAGRTFTFFFLNMAVGVALGLLMMNVLRPGDHLDVESKTRLMAEFGGAAEKHVTASTTRPAMNLPTVVDMFMPKNLFGAFVGQQRNVLGDVLPLILFAILVGAVGTQLAEERRKKLQEALELVSDLMTGIVHFALRIAPYAVPAMIYSVIIKVGLDILIALGVFVLGCGGILLFHLFVSMSVFLKIWTKRSPLQFFKDIKAVLVTAFSTSSSNASLPTALSVCKETLGVSPSTAGFVIPLGTTMNMSGTALYEGCVVLFVAQVFGVDLSFAQQITLLLLSVLSAVAVAGIPGGSLPLIAGLLATFGIPPAGIGIVLGADRILDMMRTMTNVGCDTVTAVIVDEQVKKAESAAAARAA
ncbi:MAG: dicarboxylate/amino acid:cation symporter [Opitutaceae bacterium]|nr:dicarboxylate/amino acid:cation symporter [Opitutaceae bacterium]